MRSKQHVSADNEYWPDLSTARTTKVNTHTRAHTLIIHRRYHHVPLTSRAREKDSEWSASPPSPSNTRVISHQDSMTPQHNKKLKHTDTHTHIKRTNTRAHTTETNKQTHRKQDPKPSRWPSCCCLCSHPSLELPRQTASLPPAAAGPAPLAGAIRCIRPTRVYTHAQPLSATRWSIHYMLAPKACVHLLAPAQCLGAYIRLLVPHTVVMVSPRVSEVNGVPTCDQSQTR